MSCDNYGNKLNLVVQQGATFIQTLNLKADDGENIAGIATAELRSQIRASASSAAVVESFDFTWVDHVNGVATMGLSATKTTGIAAGNYVYDVELYFPDDTVYRLFEGKVKVTAEVTK